MTDWVGIATRVVLLIGIVGLWLYWYWSSEQFSSIEALDLRDDID